MRVRGHRAVVAWALAVWLGCGLAAPSVLAEPREPQAAGAFYPSDPATLRRVIEEYLGRYPKREAGALPPRILILPHAGYGYSGPVAARGFREIEGRSYDAVVVVGFTHRERFAGASVDDRDAYRTPLGDIPIDPDAVEFLRSRGLQHRESAHSTGEHSLEVMLPFLQVTLGSFKLVPILMGSDEYRDEQGLADVLKALAQRGDYLFVFSTDLSHYHPYDEAAQRDRITLGAMIGETAAAVHRLFERGYLEACGRGPIVTGLMLAERLGYLDRQALLYANSGDTTGEKERVVGYGAVAMYPATHSASPAPISAEAGRALVESARATIDAHLRKQDHVAGPALETIAELNQARGVFVTLRKDGQLRGCIGRIETEEPLWKMLPIVALEAALHDLRFPPVTAGELADLHVEVSVLSPQRRVMDATEIVPGRDGVVLRLGERGGVFLPQVWFESGWTKREFLRELASQKAGLEPDAWEQAQLFVFQDHVFEEGPSAQRH